LWNFQ